MQLIIAHGDVVTMNPDREVLVGGGVLIDGAVVAAVGSSTALIAAHPQAEILDAHGCVVTPGMINAHQHLTGDPLVRSCIPDLLPAGAANGPSSMSHPQVPIVPLVPTACIPAATRSGKATVPASTTVVTPFCTDSSEHNVALISSSSGVCAAWSGTDHSKIEAPAGSRSGMQPRTSGSPVRCWWALIIPGVTMHPRASQTSACG